MSFICNMEFGELECIMPNRDSLQSADFLSNLTWSDIEYVKWVSEVIMASMGHCSQTLPQCNWGYGCPQLYRIASGKFLRDPNICNPRPKCKNKNHNTWTFAWTVELMEIFTHAFCVLVSLVLIMALYHYFKPAGDVLSSPTGDLLSFVSLAIIKATN